MARAAAGPSLAPLLRLATAAAGLGVGAHVIGKAARDALFVSTFPASALPYVFLRTGLGSALAVGVYARLQSRHSPRVIAPLLPVFVAVSLLAMWLWLRTRSPAATAALYVWLTITGTLVISSFWSLLSELYDVRTARRTIGALTVASSVGGLLGAVATHGLLALWDARTLLVPLAGLNLALAMLLRGMATAGPKTPERAEETAPSGGIVGGARTIVADPYLLAVAGVVALVALAGTFGDFLLKAAAAATLHDEIVLTEFFATYHGVVGGVTLGVQLLLARPLLAKKGLGPSLAVLPAFLALGAAGFMVLPPLVAAATLRGGESSARNSFHRAAYELLFVPVPPSVKRLAKLVIENLVERVADAAAALVLIGVVALGWEHVAPPVLVAVCGAAALALVPIVRRGYVASLTANLVGQAPALEALRSAAEVDATARRTLALTLGSAPRRLRAGLSRTAAGRSLLTSVTGEGEPSGVGLARRFSTRDPAELQHALATWGDRDRRAVPFLVRLLRHDDLYEPVAEKLSQHVDLHVGALADELGDARRPASIRRRIARVLGRATVPRAAEPLSEVLADEVFEVRYHAARALRALQQRGIAVDRERVWSALRRAVDDTLPVWEAQRQLADAGEAELPLRDAVARRGNTALRHVFNLLALVLEPEPVELAYRSLASGDHHLRSVALEYLDQVLPEDVRRGLWPHIGDTSSERPPVSHRAVQEILDELRSARPSEAPPEPCAVVGQAAGPPLDPE